MLMRRRGGDTKAGDGVRMLRSFIKPVRGRSVALAAATLATVIGARPAYADEVTVPISLQVELLRRVATYEKRFAERGDADAVVLVVVDGADAESARAAGQLEAGIQRTGKIGGRKTKVVRHKFSTAAALRSAVDASGAAIAYLTPGLGDQVVAIAKALEGASLISVSAVGADAEAGIVLSFELAGAKPTMIVNLRQAGRQQVAFSSNLLKLARVIR